MMKTYLIVAAVLVISVSASAQTAKPCEELKSEIAKKMEVNGVKQYSLDVVAKDKDAQGKVVGTCEGGTKKIVYSKAAAGQQTPAVEASKR
jgi:uncharacterized protein DUF1161